MPAPSTINSAMTPLEWALLIALSVLWGGAFFFVGVAIRELPPLTIVVLRVALAAIALHVVIRRIGVRLPAAGKIRAAFVAMGLLNNVIPFTLIVWGQTQVASGVASILNATTPLFTALVAHAATPDEKLTTGRLVGVIVGFAGVAIMIGGAAVGALDRGALAQLAILGAAVSYALAGVFGRRFRALGIDPLATATGQVTAASLMLLPIMLLVDRPWTLPVPSMATLAAIAGLALVSTALAYILYFRILATAGALNLLLVTFLIPVTAILLGVLVLGEALQPRHLAGMALIGAGLLAVDGRIFKVLSAAVRRTAAP